MKYIYFTKHLDGLSISKISRFLKEVGLDGPDLAIRPGYPVNPDNVSTALPDAVKQFADEGLRIGLVTAPTNLTRATSKTASAIFEESGKAGVPAIKIGYFRYRSHYDRGLTAARQRLAEFATLAEKTGVKAVYHTHSGNYYGHNCAALRLLLNDFDPHHVGAFIDTGHLSINGGPFSMESDIIRPWMSIVAVKDMMLRKEPGRGWRSYVVPAGEGIVKWDDVQKGIKAVRFNGTVSLHAEYHTGDLKDRTSKAKDELRFLKSILK